MSGQLAQTKNLCHAHPATLRSQRTWAGRGVTWPESTSLSCKLIALETMMKLLERIL